MRIFLTRDVQVPDLQRLVTRSDLVALACAGAKTEQRRQRRYGEAGDRFTCGGCAFELVAVYQQRLGDMGDEDARREGFADLAAYRASLGAVHGAQVWQPDGQAWVHTFRRVDH